MESSASEDVNSPLSSDERAELERLRTEVATLRPEPRRERHLGRRIGVWFLVFLTALLALLSVTTRYVRSEILDTNHYVATVTPLASNPAVQDQVTTSINDAIDQRIDINKLVTDSLQGLTEAAAPDRPRVDQAVNGLAPLLASQATNFVHSTVANFVKSQQFKDLWVTANRAAHQGVVAAVTGDTKHAAVDVSDTGTISIELGPIIDQVKAQLEDRGFGFASAIPSINKKFVIFQSPELARAQGLVNALDKVATILPWLGILAALGAVLAAGHGRRLRTTVSVGIAIVIAMLLLALGLLIGRFFYLNAIPTDVLSVPAAQAIFDTVIAPLRTALRAVAVAGLVVAAIAFFAGGSRSASAVRAGIGRGFGAVDARRSNRAPNEVERLAWQLRIPVRIAIVVIAALMLMFWHYPTAMVVIWTVVIAGAVLVGFEFLIAPARRSPRPAVDGPSEGESSQGESEADTEPISGETKTEPIPTDEASGSSSSDVATDH